MIQKFLTLICITSILLGGCSGNVENENAIDEKRENNDEASEEAQISSDVMFEIIESIPAPLETATLIQQLRVPFREDLLNPTENASNYSTNFKKAINLGIYGANLGYINIYDESVSAISYLSIITQIANDLRVGQFFDFHTLKRLASNRDNLDSLLYISTKGFDKMNSYLREQNRGNISVYMLVGGWMEALYLSTQITTTHAHQQLIERIGEQKITIDNIRLLLNVYKKDPNVEVLLKDFDNLKSIFDEISITTKYQEPTVREEGGTLVVKDNTVTSIDINTDQVNRIRSQIVDIRFKLIN